ncbi:hypothetical protein SBY92_000394 [Candida maltosa Xu316]
MGKGRSVKVKKYHIVQHSRSLATSSSSSSSRDAIYEEYKRSQMLDLHSFINDMQNFKNSNDYKNSESVLRGSWNRLKEQLKINDDIYHLKLLESKSKKSKGNFLRTEEIDYIELRNETLELIKPIDKMVNDLLNDLKEAYSEF